MGHFRDLVIQYCANRRVLFALIGCGIGLFMIGILISVTQPAVPTVTDALRNSWQNGTVDRQIHVYFYHWNPDEFLGGNFSVDTLNQVGPFVFDVDLKFVDILWLKDCVSYRRLMTWKFNTELSMRNLNANIIHFDEIIAVIINKYVNETDPKTRRIAEYLLSKREPLTLNHSAQTLFLEGYRDKHFHLFELSFTKFGYFMDENQTTDGLWNRKIDGKIKSWQSDSSHITMDNSVLNTKDGLFHFELVPKFCGISTFSAAGITSVNGLTGTKYVNKALTRLEVPSRMSMVPECFLGQPPFFVSSPDKDAGNSDSESFVVIEPTTGLTLESHLSFQINAHIAPVPWTETLWRNITPMDLPLLWYKETSKLSPSVQQDLRSFLHSSDFASPGRVIYILGIIVTCVGMCMFYYKRVWGDRLPNATTYTLIS